MSSVPVVNHNRLHRIDRNFAEQTSFFDNKFGADADLCRCIVNYISHFISQQNLWGFSEFDPVSFGMAMGLKSRSKLFEKVNVNAVHQFKDFDRNKETEELTKESLELVEFLRSKRETFETKIENALWKLHTISFQLKRSTGNGFESFSSPLLPNLKVEFGIRGKKKYSFTYHPYFLENISTYFLHTDLPTFLLAKEKYLGGLYLEIIHLRELSKVPNNIIKPSFDKMAILCNTNATDARDKKKKINLEIDNFNAINELFQTTITWEQKGKHKYQPILTFKDIANFEIDTKEDRLKYLNNFYQIFALEPYKMKYTSHFEEKMFKLWLKDPACDTEEKQQAFCKAYFTTFKKPIEPNSEKAQHYVATGRLV